MNKFLSLLFLVALGISPALANFDITTGSGTHVFAIDAANQGTSLCAATSTECPSTVLIDKTGTPVTINSNGQTSAANGAPVSLPLTQYSQDPCTLHGDIIGTATKSTVAISTAAGTTQLVAPLSLNQVYICSIFIQPSAAATISIIGGLSGACTTGTPAAIVGSTTLANGVALTTSNGFAPGNGGATLFSTTTPGHGVCLEQVGTAQLSGYMTYVQTQF